MRMRTTPRFARQSCANGNPESLPHLDSRFRGSDDSSLSHEGVSTIPIEDTKDEDFLALRLRAGKGTGADSGHNILILLKKSLFKN